MRALSTAALLGALFLTVVPVVALGDDEEWDVVVGDDDAAAPKDATAEAASAETGDDDDELGVRLHGSFENQVTAILPNQYNGEERLYVCDYTRLRVDVDAQLPAGISLRSDAVGRVFVGERIFYLVNLIPRRTVDRLIARDPRWASILDDRYTLENELYLDNAYLKIPMSGAQVVVGKQPLQQGAGYVWNPTDVFSRKDLFDPTYEQEGVVGLRLVLPIGQAASIDAIGAADDSFETWTYGGRARLRAGPVSMSAASYFTDVRRTRLEESMDAMTAAAMTGGNPQDAVIVSEARRTMVGGDLVLDVAGVRLWAEGAYNFVEDEDGAPGDWWEVVGGVEYFFPFETHVMVEYLHYDRGPLQDGGDYGLDDWTGVLGGELLMLGRDFLFESVDHPVADFWTVALSSFQSLSDGSASIMGQVTWDFAQSASLSLVLVGDLGDKEDFLSSSKGQGWLRLKAFF